MTHLDSILKSRDINLPTKVPQIKAMAFPVVMYGCEIWTIEKAEHQRIDAFGFFLFFSFFLILFYFYTLYNCISFAKYQTESMLLNCGIEEDCSESLGLQGDHTSSS